MNRRQTTVVAIGIAVAALAALTPSARAHRFFVSLAEVEYDTDRSAIEVSLRIDDHNLEDALRLRLGRAYRLTTDARGEGNARDYVADHFIVSAADGKALELRWIGWEWSPGIAWLHFEFPVTSDAASLLLTNSIFLELSEKQVNTVNIRSGGRRHTLTFDRKSRDQPMDLPERRETTPAKD